jgi:hypothetical protein
MPYSGQPCFLPQFHAQDKDPDRLYAYCMLVATVCYRAEKRDRHNSCFAHVQTCSNMFTHVHTCQSPGQPCFLAQFHGQHSNRDRLYTYCVLIATVRYRAEKRDRHNTSPPSHMLRQVRTCSHMFTHASHQPQTITFTFVLSAEARWRRKERGNVLVFSFSLLPDSLSLDQYK